jgi:hypothetical protein
MVTIRPSLLLRLRQCLALILGALHLPYDLIEDAKRLFIGPHNKALQTKGDHALWKFSVSRFREQEGPQGFLFLKNPARKRQLRMRRSLPLCGFLINRGKRQNAANASAISLVIVILALSVQHSLYSFTHNFGPPKRALKRAFVPGCWQRFCRHAPSPKATAVHVLKL